MYRLREWDVLVALAMLAAMIAIGVAAFTTKSYDIKSEEMMLNGAVEHLQETNHAIEHQDFVKATEEITLAVESLENCSTETCSKSRLVILEVVQLLRLYIKIGL